MSCCRVSNQVDPTTQTEKAWKSTFIAATFVTAVALAAIALTARAGLITQIPALNFQIATYSMVCGAGVLSVLALANLVFTCSLPRAEETTGSAEADGTSPTGTISTRGSVALSVERTPLPGEPSASSPDVPAAGAESSERDVVPQVTTSSHREEGATGLSLDQKSISHQAPSRRGRPLARASTAAATGAGGSRIRGGRGNSFTLGTPFSIQQQERSRRRKSDWPVEASLDSSGDAVGLNQFGDFNQTSDLIKLGDSPSASRRSEGDDKSSDGSESNISRLDNAPVESDDDCFKSSSEEE